MPDTTPRFGLPLLAAGQAQKELFHNEAITLLEVLAQGVAETAGDAEPPAAPLPGQSWIVGATPAGAWLGQAGAIATWTDGGWRFTQPVEGMTMWVTALGLAARRAAGAWVVGRVAAAGLTVENLQVVGQRQPAIADPGGGTDADPAARAAIVAILGALRAHGLIAI